MTASQCTMKLAVLSAAAAVSTLLDLMMLTQAEAALSLTPPAFPDWHSLFSGTIRLLGDDAMDRLRNNSAVARESCAYHVDMAEFNRRLNTSDPVDLSGVCSAALSTGVSRPVPARSTVPAHVDMSTTPDVDLNSATHQPVHGHSPLHRVSTSHLSSMVTTSADSLYTGDNVAQNVSVLVSPVVPATQPTIQQPAAIIGVTVAVFVFFVFAAFVVVYVCVRRRHRKSACCGRTTATHRTAANGNATVVPVSSDTNGAVHGAQNKQRAASQGGRTAPQRQDSASSTAWLIRMDSASHTCILLLPSISETAMPVEPPRTLPRRQTRPPAVDQPSSDPPRRRHSTSAASQQQQQQQQQAIGQHANDSFNDDEDNERVDSIHQNAANLWRETLTQAEMLEEDGVDNSAFDHVPDTKYYPQWQPELQLPLDSHA